MRKVIPVVIVGPLLAATILDPKDFGGGVAFYLFAVAYLAGAYGIGLLLGAYFGLGQGYDGGTSYEAGPRVDDGGSDLVLR